MITVEAIIEQWPSAEQFGGDLGLKYRSYGRTMRARGSIPKNHWPKVLEAAQSRGIALTEEDLVQAHAKRAGAAT